jgi:hypothetical protein
VTGNMRVEISETALAALLRLARKQVHSTDAAQLTLDELIGIVTVRDGLAELSRDAKAAESFQSAETPTSVEVPHPSVPPQVHDTIPTEQTISDVDWAVAERHAVRPPPLPTNAHARKAVPIATGVIDYFPDALAAVAACSKVGGEQHNPGKPLRWDRSKSGDESDALMRHFLERGTLDTDGIRHSAKVAWRALALLQKELETARKAIGT